MAMRRVPSRWPSPRPALLAALSGSGQAQEMPRSYQVFFDFDRADLTAKARQIVDDAADNATAGKVTRIDVHRLYRHRRVGRV